MHIGVTRRAGLAVKQTGRHNVDVTHTAAASLFLYRTMSGYRGAEVRVPSCVEFPDPSNSPSFQPY